MLAIRMKRVGRSGHAHFRMVVQDSRFHPTSGRVVAYLGYYNPHTKQSNFDKEKLESYLKNGAQPSDRVIKLLKAEKVKLPSWVQAPAKKKKAIRNPDKRRSTRPPQEQAEEGSAAQANIEAEPQADAAVEESPAEETTVETAEQEAPAKAAKETTEPQAKEAPVAESTEPAQETKTDEPKAEE